MDNQFAERICEAAHPHRRMGGLPVPCGEHRRAADFMDVLTRPGHEGDILLKAVLDQRRENIARQQADERGEANRQREAEGKDPLPEVAWDGDRQEGVPA